MAEFNVSPLPHPGVLFLFLIFMYLTVSDLSCSMLALQNGRLGSSAPPETRGQDLSLSLLPGGQGG